MDWNDLKQKLAQLETLDKMQQLFGASSHRYQLRPVVTEADVISAETKLGITLPQQLRSFYLHMGNGGAGPHYGIKQLDDIYQYQPNDPYRGMAHYRELAKTKGQVWENNKGGSYYELDHKWLEGLLGIIEIGCGHVTCIISAGDNIGKIVRLSLEGKVADSQYDFITCYTDWLDENLRLMETAKELVDDASYSIEGISAAIREKHGRYGGHKLAMSIIGVTCPHGSLNQEKAWCADKLETYRLGELSAK